MSCCSSSPKDTTTASSITSGSGTTSNEVKMEIHIDNIDSICAGRKLTGTIHIPRSIRRSMEEEDGDDILRASSSPSFSFEDNNDGDEKGRNTTNRKDKNTNDDDSSTTPKVCIYMEIIGTETTVVSTPKSYASPETFEVNYLRKTRGQTSLLYRKGIEVVTKLSSSNDDYDYDDGRNRNGDGERTIRVPFEFKLPLTLPGSMEYIDQHEEKYALPHQWYVLLNQCIRTLPFCFVSYFFFAHIFFAILLELYTKCYMYVLRNKKKCCFLFY